MVQFIIFGILIIFGIAVGNVIDTLIQYNEVQKESNYYFVYNPSTHTDFYGAIKNLPAFTFSQFLKFYNLNPKSWVCCRNSKLAPLPAKRGQDLNGYYNCRVYHPINFINAFEYRKYRRWAKKQLKNKTIDHDRELRTANTKEFISLIQEDIDVIRQEHEKVIQETENVLCESLNNLQVEAQEHHPLNNNLVGKTFYRGVASNGEMAQVIESNTYKC